MQKTDTVEIIGQKISDERPAHEDFTVGEVDHAQNAIHQGVPQGDQRIDAAQGQPEDNQILPDLGAVFTTAQGGNTAPDYSQQDG